MSMGQVLLVMYDPRGAGTFRQVRTGWTGGIKRNLATSANSWVIPRLRLYIGTTPDGSNLPLRPKKRS